MRLCDIKKDSVLLIKNVLIDDENVVRRLSEIGINIGRKIRFIKKSKLSKCVLVESMGSVFILDKNISEGIVCHE